MIEQLKNQWEDILLHLREEYDVSEPSYNTWLLPLKPYAADNHVVKILVPDSNPHYVAIIRKRYEKQLQVSIAEVTGISCAIELITEADIVTFSRQASDPERYDRREPGGASGRELKSALHI